MLALRGCSRTYGARRRSYGHSTRRYPRHYPYRGLVGGQVSLASFDRAESASIRAQTLSCMAGARASYEYILYEYEYPRSFNRVHPIRRRTVRWKQIHFLQANDDSLHVVLDTLLSSEALDSRAAAFDRLPANSSLFVSGPSRTSSPVPPVTGQGGQPCFTVRHSLPCPEIIPSFHPPGIP